MAEAKGGAAITSTPFKDAIAKPKGGFSSPSPSQNNKSGKK